MHFDPMSRAYVLDPWDAQPTAPNIRQGGQPMQPQNQTQPSQQMPVGLSASSRPVSNREEAMGVPADFNGTLMVFPDVGHNRVYLKRWNYQTGTADFVEYAPTAPQTAQNAAEATSDSANVKVPAWATVDDLNGIKAEIDDIRDEIWRMKKPASTEKKGARKNDADE